MTTSQTIDGLPSELLDRIADPYRREPGSIHLHNADIAELRALLDAPVTGWKVWGKDRCDHCCNGDRCEDASHVERSKCQYCKGTGMAIWLNKPAAQHQPDPVLCKFYDVTDWPGLVRELVGHVALLQDSAQRNVKPWEDTFPPTLLPAYIERMNAANAASQPQGEPVAQKYDDTLLPFVALMRKELHANAGKGDRPGWLGMSSDTCLLEIIYHFGKLQKAVKKGDADGMAEYAADVANMCMMILDICGALAFVEKPAPVAVSPTCCG
ncbi:hypothetical protein [Pseudomonas sp. Z13]|uniref:hypothetical protein n=1 Tax=Pseudomonas sp. Z13 TaxID=2983409 RepID=UPI002E80CC72|nr:hypothetical protein [Pseudomonas sp. Z13]